MGVALKSKILVNFFMSPHRRRGRHIVFGVDPVGVGVALSDVQDILLTSGWIGTKLAWI